MVDICLSQAGGGSSRTSSCTSLQLKKKKQKKNKGGGEENRGEKPLYSCHTFHAFVCTALHLFTVGIPYRIGEIAT